jgi:urease gamma subunit
LQPSPDVAGASTLAEVRLFVVDGAGDDWSELTAGGEPTVRLAAPDLQRAQRGRARIQSDRGNVEVILDVTVAVASDFRSVRDLAVVDDGTLRYAGTVDGLAGLIADIEVAGVADGVTLIAASPRVDLRELGRDVLQRLALRDQKSA